MYPHELGVKTLVTHGYAKAAMGYHLVVLLLLIAAPDVDHFPAGLRHFLKVSGVFRTSAWSLIAGRASDFTRYELQN
jgi:hypothetical protein